MRVDNVICRTPARNAQNLELVKSEILEMVDRVVSTWPQPLQRIAILGENTKLLFAGL